MKKLPLGLFIGYLVFLSAKSFNFPTTTQETYILAILCIIVASGQVIKFLHERDTRQHLLMKEELELKRPRHIDPEIAKLSRENEIEALKLKKFITEQEFSKREVSKVFEVNGGLKF